MNFGLIRWMRRVLPRGDLVTVAVGIEMLIECGYLLKVWFIGGVGGDEFFRGLRLGWLLFCAVSYGSYRIVAFHPAADSQYRRWLELSPWTADKPLPGGPLQLVPQDLVVICGLCLLLRTPSLVTLYIPTAFLFSYQMMLAFFARMIGHWKLAYLIGFALGLVALLVRQPEAAFAAADGCFIIGRIAVNHALRSFPWVLPWQADMPSLKAIADEEKRRRLGWPYDQMTPKSPERVISHCDGICVPLLIGWWWFVILSLLPMESKCVACFLAILGTFLGFFVRITPYVASHRSPLSFFGRVFTLRWIIPSYDKIVVAPIAALIVSVALQFTALWMLEPNPMRWAAVNPSPAIIVSTSGIVLSLMLLLVSGPVLESWRMAGKHRIVFDLAANEKVGKADQFIEL